MLKGTDDQVVSITNISKLILLYKNNNEMIKKIMRPCKKNVSPMGNSNKHGESSKICVGIAS